MDFRGRDFQDSDRRYAELKRQHDAGTIDDEEFDAQRSQLMVKDNEGRWWAKGREAGDWHYHGDTGWVKGTPPGYHPAPEGVPAESTPEDHPWPEQAEPAPAESRARDGVAGGGILRRRALPWVLVVGLVAAVALAGVAMYLLGRPTATAALPEVVGRTQEEAEQILESGGFEVEAQTQESLEEDEGRVLEQSPSDGGKAKKSSTVAITVGGGPPSGAAGSPKEGLKPAPGYQPVNDGSGNLTVEVPSGWEVITGEESEGNPSQQSWSTFAEVSIGSSITASSDLDAWYTPGGAAPGVYTVASRKLAQKYTDSALAVSGPNDGSHYRCERGESQNLNRSTYSGRIQAWDCPGSVDAGSRTLLTLAAMPQGRECAVALQVWIYNEVDREVARHILDTFEVDCRDI